MSGYQNPFVAPYGMMPYQAPYQSPAIQAPQSQVVRVNGENGARAYQIGANSSALLLDESGAMVWLVTTDGAGYKTVAPYDIVPHQSAPAPDFSALETRAGILAQLAKNSPMMGTIRNMMGMVNGAQNPQAMIQQLAMNNPQMRQVMSVINENGGDPQKAFYALAEKRGVDPQEILNMLK